MRDWLKAFFNLGKISRILLDRTARILHATKATMSFAIDLRVAVAALQVTADALIVRLDALKANQMSAEDAQALADAAAGIQAVADKLNAA